MSKDIRSFFSVVSKKEGDKKPNSVPTKKRAKKLSDSDEDDGRKKAKNEDVQKAKKRKVNAVIVSDSEEDDASAMKTPEKKKSKMTKTENLKPVNIADVFSTSPIQQSKLGTKKPQKTEVDFYEGDDDFEKTLIELDEETIINNASVLTSPVVQNKRNNKIKPEELNLNESGIDPDQERFEKRRQNFAGYQRYLNRGPPIHLGQKEYPKGKPNCLQGICFLRTGVLDSLDGEAFETLIKEHGGRIVHAISRKVNYLVVGEEAGPAKLAKADSFGIPTISENELLDMILVKSGMEQKYVKSNDDNMKGVSPKKDEDKKKTKEVLNKNKNDEDKYTNGKASKPKIEKDPAASGNSLKKEKNRLTKQTVELNSEPVKLIDENQERKLTQSKDLKPINKSTDTVNIENLPWTDKYKPQSTKDIIGQQGNDSPMNKLKQWLRNWHKTYNNKIKGPRGLSDSFKCALLSGSPGVGKTTTATLVAKELGFDVVEFNASDTRNKKLLAHDVSRLLDTTSLATYFKNGEAPSKKHVLLMDEVDGMSGNEDRGGMQELIALIKKSMIPVICMCNDRYNQKIASLSNYCLDLRFTKPRMEQIRGAMMSICFKEKLKLNPNAVAEIITGTDNDVRQTLTHLSFFTRTNKEMSVESAKTEAENSRKDTQLSPWDVCRKVFTGDKNAKFNDKCKLFFYDYSLVPLFIHENYKNVDPGGSDVEKLGKVAAAANAISYGDKIDSLIRGSNNWSLLDLQGVHSLVLPGHYMHGGFSKRIEFPRWLGSNSKRNKCRRLLSELESHMLISTGTDSEGLNLEYLPLLKSKLLNCLLDRGTTDGVQDAINILNAYNLTREDLDSIMELTDYDGSKPFASVDSKVKAAFTRTYNKTCQKLSYSLTSSSKKRVQINDTNDDDEMSDNQSEDEDISKDKMIVVNKKKGATSKKGDEKGTAMKKEAASKKGGTSKGKKVK